MAFQNGFVVVAAGTLGAIFGGRLLQHGTESGWSLARTGILESF